MGKAGSRLSRVLGVGAAIMLAGSSQAAAAECGPYEDATRTTHRSVRWEDFRGERPTRRARGRLEAPAAKAHIATSIKVERYGVELRREERGWLALATEVCARAFMRKDLSGAKGEHRSRGGLAHEQGHFDLTELLARSLRDRLARAEYGAPSREEATEGLHEQIRTAYAETMADMKEMQRRYDSETWHETNRPMQRRWLKKIADLLAGTPGPSVLRADEVALVAKASEVAAAP